jgi:hypothetical protein
MPGFDVSPAKPPSLALGVCVHTGWAVVVVAGGDWDRPVLVAREHLELLGDGEGFVFHRAAEMEPGAGRESVARARKDATQRASAVLTRLAATHPVTACALVAKKTAMLPFEDIVAAHPRIHTAEGCFYRDVMKAAAEAAGLRVQVIAPSELDAKDARLAKVGRSVGRPWTVDWKMALMGAWIVAG